MSYMDLATFAIAGLAVLTSMVAVIAAPNDEEFERRVVEALQRHEDRHSSGRAMRTATTGWAEHRAAPESGS